MALTAAMNFTACGIFFTLYLNLDLLSYARHIAIYRARSKQIYYVSDIESVRAGDSRPVLDAVYQINIFIEYDDSFTMR